MNQTRSLPNSNILPVSSDLSQPCENPSTSVYLHGRRARNAGALGNLRRYCNVHLDIVHLCGHFVHHL